MAETTASTTTTAPGHGPAGGSWMDEQAAEYADLVGSFVESVHDEETDEMVEYQLIWEGGDLGVALTPIETSGADGKGVMVSRVTGKGFPFGIKNVGPGDILLSINLRDTTQLTLDQVVAFLQECDLPATLRFKKVSPDLDKAPAPPAVPRVSNIVITSDPSQITSPVGSQRPSVASTASGRFSQKSVVSVGTYSQQQQQQQHHQRQQRGLSNTSSRPSGAFGRMSVASQPRPSDGVHVVPPPPPPSAVRQSSSEQPQKANATAAVPPLSRSSSSQRQQPSPPKSALAPAAAAAAAAAATAPAPVSAPAPSAPAVATAATAVDRLTVGSNVSGADDRPSWKSSEEDIDDARERIAEAQQLEGVDEDSIIVDDEELPTVQRKHAESVAMLGNYSIQTSGIPILPEQSTMSVITAVDGVIVESDDDVSPLGHAVQPSSLSGSTRGSSRGSTPKGSLDELNKPDIPRESVRLTIDGGAGEPMMKSQPIGTLHELCAKGNARSVMQHLKVNGPDQLIQREPNHGQTCLHLAVKSGNVQLVKHILEQYEPVDELVNIEDDKGNTALHFAATKTPGMVHLLLECGASANVKNARKLTPLIISVITSRDDNIIIPRMLLKFGANPNDMHDSHTVIHTAVGSGLLNIAGALVRAGAKLDVEDTEGKNLFEKLDKKSIRFLLSHIYFPPTYITEKERADCMLCHKKIKFGHRKNNCTHCGRLCCSECSALQIEMFKFPMGFPGRIRKGAAVRDLKRVCKTCYGVFKERGDTPQKEESRFISRVIGVEWDEVNPNKLQQTRAAGRRGEKDF